MLLRMALLVAWLAAGSGLVRAGDAQDLAFAQTVGAAVPAEATFIESDGRPVRLGDLFGPRPLILALGYFHCPTLCAVLRDDLMIALSRSGLRAGADYDLLVASIDPAETPADAMQAKAEDEARHPTAGSSSGWHYLVGEGGAIGAVSRAVGFRSRYDAALKQILHPAGLVVLTPEGRVSGYVLGVGYHAGDLRSAVTLASSGGIGRAALPLALICFQYDAATGRYSLAVMKVLRLAGLFTVLTMGTVLALALRRERRATKVQGGA